MGGCEEQGVITWAAEFSKLNLTPEICISVQECWLFQVISKYCSLLHIRTYASFISLILKAVGFIVIMLLK